MIKEWLILLQSRGGEEGPEASLGLKRFPVWPPKHSGGALPTLTHTPSHILLTGQVRTVLSKALGSDDVQRVCQVSMAGLLMGLPAPK